MRFVLDIIIGWLALSFQSERGPFESPWKTFHCCDGKKNTFTSEQIILF